MGVCSTILRPSAQARLSKSLHTYPRVCTIKIKSKDLNDSPNDPFNFVLTDPIHLRLQPIIIGGLEITATQCILPGIDPHGEYFKKCQDYCMILHNEQSIFIALFDAHGEEGNLIINYCGIYCERYYATNWYHPLVINIQPDPVEFITNLAEECDRDLLKPESKIDTSYSGTTAIFLLIYNEVVYTASIGDSRAILCSTIESTPLVPFVPIEENNVISQLKISRSRQLSEKIFPLQLTKDHKPEDNEEYQRIIDYGGKVKRASDQEGNKIGPYRVWDMETNTIGLTMTRSIGDSTAKTIGVISKPQVTCHNIDSKHDLFIVVASDGIWQCMDNQDVANFVEYYRPISCKEIIRHKDSEVSVSNSCIAQLLCEEARVRWFSIVEADDVMIDDISCVVLELSGGMKGFVRKPQKKHGKTVKIEKKHSAFVEKKQSVLGVERIQNFHSERNKELLSPKENVKNQRNFS